MRPIRPSLNHIWITTFAEYDADGTLLREEGYWYDGPVAQAGGGMAAVIEQEHYRIRNDNTGADPGTPNWISTEDQATRTVIDVDTMFRIRFVIANTGDANANATYALYFSHEGGTYTAVAASGTAVITADATTPTDADTLTTANFQLSAGTGTAANGEYDENNSISNNLAAGDYTEFEYCVQLNSSAGIADGDTFDFKVYYDGAEPDVTDFTALVEANKPAITGDASFDITADQTQDNNKITNEVITYLNQLSESSSGIFVVTGTSTFGINLSYLATGVKAFPESITFSSILDEASQVNALLAETTTFSYTLSFDRDIGGLAILDDPVYSAGNYIFVDLTNVLAASTGITAGSITFTNNLGLQESVLLVGNAAQQLVINLAQSQIANKVTSETETFTTLHDLGLTTAEFVTFIANIDVDLLSTTQVDGLKSIFYNLALAKDSVNTKITSDSLVLTGDFDTNFIVNLLANTTIAFDTQVNFENTVQADLTTALEFLTNLDFTILGDTGITGIVSFDMNLLETTQVQQLLNSTVTLINLLSDNYQKAALQSQAIEFFTQLQQQQLADTAILDAIQFTLQAQQVQTNTLTAGKAVSIILDLAEQANVQINFTEALTLLTQLSKESTASKSLLETVTFDVEASQAQQLILNKLATIAFNNTLDYLTETKMTLGAAVDFTVLLATLFNGEVSGSIEGLITFQAELQQALTTQTVYNPVVDLSKSLQTIQSAAKTTSTDISLDVSLNQIQTKLLDKALSIAFDAAFEQVQIGNVDFYVLANLISSFTDLYIGDVNNAITGLIEFSMLAQQNQVVLSIENKTVNFNTLLSHDGVGTVLQTFLESIQFNAQFLDQQDVSVDLNDFITLNTYLDYSKKYNIDYAPSINFDFQSLLASTSNKNTLANILLDFDAAINTAQTTGVAAFISYALQQDYITDFTLTTKGEVELTTELAESPTLQQILGTGIQFGHLMGLSAISRADFADLISFGTVTDLSVTGRYLELEITLPDDRKCKIYFEDRLIITYPDE